MGGEQGHSEITENLYHLTQQVYLKHKGTVKISLPIFFWEV